MQRFFVDAFVQQQQPVPPRRIVLDLDTTDFPLHGHQLGRFFHGYYDEYCYLPLYIFRGDRPLPALLRPADIDDAAGRSSIWPASWGGFGSAGRRCASWCAATAVFAGNT